MSETYHDIIILGAGASGLMAAYRYKERDIALIDANHSIAQKIKISGGGKCNITNISVGVENFYGEDAFIQKSLDAFSKEDLLRFLEDEGLKPILRKKYFYFCEDSSEELIMLFKQRLRQTKFYLESKVLRVEKDEKGFTLYADDKTWRCQQLVVASGGLSYPKIGASGIAFEIAEFFGHHVRGLKPALVGFTVQKEQFWFKALSGISCAVKVRVGEKVFCEDLLFTHKGISGPVILNASLYWDKGEIEIDFVPSMSLQKLQKTPLKKIPLPKRFLSSFLERYPLEMLKSYRFAPAGNFGYSKAEVTRGGIDTEEIDVENMMSQKIKNLYFIGECLDVTGELGGYNFQWAFSSAQNLKLF